jgi:hypothetical protein
VCVWRQEIHRAETRGIEHFDLAEIDHMGEAEARELDGLLRFDREHFAEDEKSRLRLVLAGDAPGDSHRPIVEAAAQEMGVSADPSTVAGRLAERTILRGYATLLEELRETIAAIPREFAAPSAPTLMPTQPITFEFTQFWGDFEGISSRFASGRPTRPPTRGEAGRSLIGYFQAQPLPSSLQSRLRPISRGRYWSFRVITRAESAPQHQSSS